MNTETDRTRPRGATRHYRVWAWWSLILLPVSLALAFVVGEGIPVLFGTPDDAASAPPLWVMAIALTAAALVFAAPLLLTWHFTNKAAAASEDGARLPLIVGSALAGLFILANLASGLLVLIFG